MDPQVIQSIVEKVVLQLKQKEQNKLLIPIAISARHAHLSTEHLANLFGPGYELTKKADLSQPGQFAANETVLIAGPKGTFESVRILGPARGATQVEVSKTDAVKLGLNPPLRESGDIKGSSPVTIIGPKGSITISEGLIIAQCHIHMTPKDAAYFGVQHGDWVRIRTQGIRPIVYEKVLIRVSEKYALEMHVDTDEANAALLSGKGTGILANEAVADTIPANPAVADTAPVDTVDNKTVVYDKKLLSQRDVQDMDVTTIVVSRLTIITPLARDTARAKGVTILVKPS